MKFLSHWELLNASLLLGQILQVVADGHCILLRSQSEIARMCKFWMMLTHLVEWTGFLCQFEVALFYDVLLINEGNRTKVRSVPSIIHYLSKARLITSGRVIPTWRDWKVCAYCLIVEDSVLFFLIQKVRLLILHLNVSILFLGFYMLSWENTINIIAR